jgi:hypothetical protein
MSSVDKLRSGKYRARYREVPGGPQKTRSFIRMADARAWLAQVGHDLLSGTYRPREAGPITLEAYAAEYVSRRQWRTQTADRKERDSVSMFCPSSAPSPWPT